MLVNRYEILYLERAPAAGLDVVILDRAPVIRSAGALDRGRHFVQRTQAALRNVPSAFS